MPSKKIKIAFILTTFPDFLQTYINSQIIDLERRGVKIEIFAFKKGSQEKVPLELKGRAANFLNPPDNLSVRIFCALPKLARIFFRNPSAGIRVLNFKKYGRNVLKFIYWCEPFLGKEFDLVHCHFGMVGNKFLIIRDILGLRHKFITTIYGQDSSKYIKAKGLGVYDRLKRECSYFLLMTKEMKERFVKLGFPPEKLVVHYTGFDTADYKFRSRVFKPGDIFQIITVGRFVEKKGIDDALRTLKIVVEKYPAIKLNIVGGGDEAFDAYLKNIVEELKIAKNAVFRGLMPHKETISLFSQMHLMLQLSKTAANGDTDDLPFVLLEAQASGLPVVSTYHVGIPDGVQDGATGFLVPEKDYQKAAEKILFLINNPGKLEELSRTANKFAVENFGLENLNKALINLYQKLTDK